MTSFFARGVGITHGNVNKLRSCFQIILTERLHEIDFDIRNNENKTLQDLVDDVSHAMMETEDNMIIQEGEDLGMVWNECRDWLRCTYYPVMTDLLFTFAFTKQLRDISCLVVSFVCPKWLKLSTH
jgi:hypothetical protein